MGTVFTGHFNMKNVSRYSLENFNVSTLVIKMTWNLADTFNRFVILL